MNNTSVIILAAGDQRRWAPGGYKQMVDIKGKPSIHILVDHARAVWAVEPWIAVKSENPAPFGLDYNYFLPSNHEYIFDTMFSTRGLWRKETIILMGDAFYSAAAMQLLKDGKEIFYGDPGEIYAMKFRPRDWQRIKDACRMARERGGSKIWHIYRMMEGYRIDEHKFDKDFHRIENGENGIVMWDFDRVNKYEKFMKEYIQYA